MPLLSGSRRRGITFAPFTGAEGWVETLWLEPGRLE